MQELKTADLSSELQEVSAGLARWRSGRRGGEPIPEALWASATDLAVRFGINPVALGLGLNYTAVKERVQRARASAVVPSESSLRFVELPGLEPAAQRTPSQRLPAPTSLSNGCSPPAPSRSELRLHLQAPDGSSMRIDLNTTEPQELAGVVAAFWGRPCSR